MQGGEPVAPVVDHRTPVGLERRAVRGEHAIRRSEDHAAGGEGRIEFVADDVAVERGEAAAERQPGRGPGRLVGEAVGAGLAGGDRGGEQIGGQVGRPGNGGERPGRGLEHPQVGPHPVLAAPVGQSERLEGVERPPAPLGDPAGLGMGGDQGFEAGPVEGDAGGRSGSGGRGHRARAGG
jgi:hypothetical protein